MKKIVVFGANGRTGEFIVLHALDRNFQVTAIVRNPASFEVTHPGLTIVKGDILKPESFAQALQNAAQ